MILKSLRNTGWPALLVCTAVAACSKAAPPADAFVAATLGGGSSCNMRTGSAVNIGTATGKSPTTVADGNPQAGFNVDVSCTVSSNGGGFDLKLSATQEGMMGGTLTIVTVPGKPVPAQGGPGLSGSFSTSTGSFQDSNCTLSFSYSGGPVPISPPISPGTIFGHISCPNAQSTSGTMQTLMDGASITQTCDGEADFYFTNCGQ
jgi:hypothetical protein